MKYSITGGKKTKLKVHKNCSNVFCHKRLKPNEKDVCMECRRKAQLLMRGY